MSISVVGGQELNQTQALDLQDISAEVPGLNPQEAGSRLDGILRGENAGGTGASVNTVVVDVPMSFSAATSDGAILRGDCESYDYIEVLRGPRYGAAAQGGLIKYVTKASDLSAFHCGFEAGVKRPMWPLDGLQTLDGTVDGA